MAAGGGASRGAEPASPAPSPARGARCRGAPAYGLPPSAFPPSSSPVCPHRRGGGGGALPGRGGGGPGGARRAAGTLPGRRPAPAERLDRRIAAVPAFALVVVAILIGWLMVPES